MPPLTLAGLVAEPSLRLEVRSGHLQLDRVVRNAQVSDVEHARYLLPGELIMTNGLWLELTDPRAWVDELVSVGVAAIVYGIDTPMRPSVPETLTEACESANLPLLVVPDGVPFSAIEEIIREHTGLQDGSRARLQLMRLRRLMHELARGDSYDAPLDVLRRETRLPVALVGPAGRLIEGELPADPDIASAASRGARRGELPKTIANRFSAFGIGGYERSELAVVVGAPLDELDDDARLVIEQVAAYIVLAGQVGREHDAVRSALAEELVQLAWRDNLIDSTFVARLQSIDFESDAPITVIASSNSREEVMCAARAPDIPCVYTDYRGLRLVLAQGDPDAVLSLVTKVIEEGGEDPVLGLGGPQSGPSGLRAALAEAIATHRLAVDREPGDRVVRSLGLGSHLLLLDFLDPQVLRTYRESILGPVERWDAAHDSELLETASAFLVHDGHWRKTAAHLRIHPNTLHYRIAKFSELSGRSLVTTSGRVDVALAIAASTTTGH